MGILLGPRTVERLGLGDAKTVGATLLWHSARLGENLAICRYQVNVPLQSPCNQPRGVRGVAMVWDTIGGLVIVGGMAGGFTTSEVRPLHVFLHSLHIVLLLLLQVWSFSLQSHE